jgi:hypothetical protein
MLRIGICDVAVNKVKADIAVSRVSDLRLFISFMI